MCVFHGTVAILFFISKFRQKRFVEPNFEIENSALKFHQAYQWMWNVEENVIHENQNARCTAVFAV